MKVKMRGFLFNLQTRLYYLFSKVIPLAPITGNIDFNARGAKLVKFIWNKASSMQETQAALSTTRGYMGIAASPATVAMISKYQTLSNESRRSPELPHVIAATK